MEWFCPRSSPPSPPEFGSIHPAEHEPHHVIINSSRFSPPAMRPCLGKGSYPQVPQIRETRGWSGSPISDTRQANCHGENVEAQRFILLGDSRNRCRASAWGAGVGRGWLGGLGRILPEQEPHGAAAVRLLISIPHPQVNLSFLDFLSRNIFHLHHFPFCLCIYPPDIFCALSVLRVLCFPLLLL